METALHFINELLRNMLDMNRASSNQLNIEVGQVNLLADVFQPVVSMLYRRGMSDIKVLIDCPPNIVLKTDRLRLQQVVLNIGRNSINFVERGSIRFRVDAGSSSTESGTTRIYIEDTGPGIPLEKRDKLFAKYQKSLDSLVQGTGVGLALCKKLVELMGADIWLDESYDSGVPGCPGARFVIDMKARPIPVESIFVSSTDATEQCSSAHGNAIEKVSDRVDEIRSPGQDSDLPKGLSVLFVDDDTILRRMFTRSVRKVAPDWRIQDVANGETALRMVEHEPFGLIFVDQYMASVEKQLLGTETCRILRAKGVGSIVCGLSANDMESSFLDSGADAFMMKPLPCDVGSLKRELLRVLASGRESVASTQPESEDA